MKKWMILCTFCALFICCALTANAAIGDPDRSGDVTAADARLVLRNAVRLEEFTHPAYTGSEETVSVTPASCTGAGELRYRCACGEVLAAVLPPVGHTPGKTATENEVAATCTAAGGYDAVVYCTVCGAELSRTPGTTEKLPHTPGEEIRENEVAATCTAAGGYDAVVYCTVCGTELSRTPGTTEKLPHTPGGAVRENDTAPTCGAPGGYDTAAYCTVCGAECSRAHTVVPALPHVSVAPASPAACIGTEAALPSVYRCADCGTYLQDADGNIPLKNYYQTLPAALAAAAEGDTVVLLSDQTLTGDVCVPAGVTLLLPYDFGSLTVNGAEAKLACANAGPNDAVSAVTPPGQDVTVTLTLSGCTLTVQKDALLVLGGLYTGSHPIGGATYGAHAEINLENDAALRVEGTLSTYGYITGAGEIALSGGALYLPLVITDFHGGTYSALSYINEKVSPFNGYACPNVQCPVAMDAAASVYGYCVLYASGVHNAGTAKLIAASDALLCLAPQTTARLVYQADIAVAGFECFGRTSVTVSGDAALRSLQMKVTYVNMDTRELLFPLPYNVSYTQQSGALTLEQGVKLMPGASVTVAENAALRVKSRLYVLDGFAPGLYSGYHYPSAALLAAAGLTPRARLVVNGEMTVEDGAVFAGIAETDGAGRVSFASAATLGGTLSDGLLLNEDFFGVTAIATNRTEYTLAALLADASGALFAAGAGKTYVGVPGEAAVQTGFDYVRYTGDAETPVPNAETVTFPAPVTLRGCWEQA